MGDLSATQGPIFNEENNSLGRVGRRRRIARVAANILGLMITWAAWLWYAGLEASQVRDALTAIGGALAIVPVVFTGRWLLDRQPTVHRARWTTLGAHYLVAILLGCSLIAAVRFGLDPLTRSLPLPAWLGVLLMLISGFALVVVIFNLLLKGFGLPFAVSLTRLVVTDWLYAWTRNPMVLSALAFLVGLGLWLGSGLFLVYALAVVSPAVLVFLTVYEERELEVRFGQDYMAYKESTPRLWPRRPKR